MNYNNVVFEKAFGNSAQLINSDLPEICFAGRSNVGKSSLINKILNRKSFARVSTKPGKTITINFYRVENVRLVDLPGYGYAKISADEKMRFAELMENYFTSKRNIKTVFSLIDMRHKPSADDIHMLKFLMEFGLKFNVVLTKSDKLNKSERLKMEKEFTDYLSFLPKETQIIYFSSVTGEGADKVREIIKECSDNPAPDK